MIAVNVVTGLAIGRSSCRARPEGGASRRMLDRSQALAVALVARLLFTLADLVAAAAVVPVRLRSSEAV